MFDPVTVGAVLTTATSAFNNLKKAFAMGRDIESMGSDLSRWMRATSDIDEAVKSTKNPPFYRKFLSGDTVENAAVQSVIAQKKCAELRYALEMQIKMSWGVKAWEDVLKEEARIRKVRTENIYKAQKLKQQIVEGFFMFLLFVTVIGFIIFIVWLKKKQDAS